LTTGDFAFENIENALPDADNIIELPLLIVPGQVVYPGTLAPLMVVGKAGVIAADMALENDTTAIVALRRDSAPNAPLLETLHPVACEVALEPMPDDDVRSDRLILMAEGRRRVEVLAIVRSEPYPIARAFVLSDTIHDAEKLRARMQAVLDLFSQVLDKDDSLPEEMVDYIFMVDDPAELSDLLASTLEIDAPERQKLLEQLDVDKRLEQISLHLARELHRLEIADEMNDRVNEEISKVQREMYLREQMRVIQQELGENADDIFQQEITELRESILKARLPQEVHERAMKETARLAIMSPMSPESGVIRTYIDWLLTIPWHERSRDNLNLKNAERVLEKDHYGLEKIKDRVLEHIAVRKLARNKMKSPVLCFVGPPGVGKTSLGKSIAEALGRKFVRMSLGGVHDEAEIRGHRRTYIGALPGRIVQTMKRAGTRNPVFMLDEIDKMAEDYRGDPAAALLEVLDPEQNNEFMDHYLEVPYDLSEVLFIATANDLYPLPEALEDRLEIIEFRAYTEEEKLEIAKRFLIPRQIESHGLQRRGIQFQKDALETLIRQYTLEAGVRNLEREIASICRKITRLVATEKLFPKRITPPQVEKFLGPPQVFRTHVNREDNIGLATGLVWTSSGGDIQIIEASLLPGKGSLTLTGSLGDVLQESAQTALSYMRSRAKEMGVPHDDFEDYDVHIHMPEGAVPKDGPSAGITLAIAIISVFTERKIRAPYAMTGEVTLRGHVLPVGGVKEKVLAARRYGFQNIILPKENEKDLVDVPKQALKDLNILFVDNMQSIMDVLLLEAPAQRQRDIDAEKEDAAAEEAEKERKTRRKKKSDSDD
jgi:ATP-dependent Lon protease